MKLKEITKKIKDEFKVDYWLTIILPASILVGILGQISMLSKYNAVIFFSWGQVFSDTSILIFPVISFFIGYISYLFFCKLKPNLKEKYLSFLILLALICLFVFILSYFNILNIYLIGIPIFYFLGYTQSVINGLIKLKKDKEINNKYEILLFPFLLLFLVILIFLVLLFFFTPYYSYLYKNVEIKVNNVSYKVEYMNDKYIIYGSGNIIPNDGSKQFTIKNILQQTR